MRSRPAPERHANSNAHGSEVTCLASLDLPSPLGQYRSRHRAHACHSRPEMASHRRPRSLTQPPHLRRSKTAPPAKPCEQAGRLTRLVSDHPGLPSRASASQQAKPPPLNPATDGLSRNPLPNPKHTRTHILRGFRSSRSGRGAKRGSLGDTNLLVGLRRFQVYLLHLKVGVRQ